MIAILGWMLRMVLAIDTGADTARGTLILGVTILRTLAVAWLLACESLFCLGVRITFFPFPFPFLTHLTIPTVESNSGALHFYAHYETIL